MGREQAEIEIGDMNADENLGTALHEAYVAVSSAAGIQLEERSPSRLRLLAVLRRAIIESNNRLVARQGAGSPYRDPLFKDLTEVTSLKPVATKSLEQVMKAITSDATRPELRGKSIVKREAHWRALKEFFGATTPLVEIRREDVRAFMDLLKRVPSNATKHYPGKTLQQAADLADREGLPLMSSDTANGYLRSLGSIFRFAVEEGFVDSDPTQGILLPKGSVSNKNKRSPFDLSDLRAIFAAPLYTGAVDDESGYARPGPNVVRRGRFWVPIIALFSGMRLNEICQLTVDDFVEEDGVPIILIREDDDDETKRVKTKAGIRFVPVRVCRSSRTYRLEAPAIVPIRSRSISTASGTRWASPTRRRSSTRSATPTATLCARPTSPTRRFVPSGAGPRHGQRKTTDVVSRQHAGPRYSGSQIRGARSVAPLRRAT